MVILGHGSDLSLAPTVGPLARQSGRRLQPIAGDLAKAGFHGLQLDATLPGIRPRDLSHRARQDLIAMLAREGMVAAGLDLFIPRKHFIDPTQLDRAMAATLAAIELAGDLGRLPLSLALPVDQVSPDALAALVEAADGFSVPLGIHAEDRLDALAAWLDELDQPMIGAAIDPAALIAGDHSPAKAAAKLGKRLRIARLSDCTGPAGDAASQRCPPGQGELDLMAYRLTLDMAQHRRGPVVLDLRNLSGPGAAAQQARAAWDDAAPIL